MEESIKDLKRLALEELSWCVTHYRNAFMDGDKDLQNHYGGQIKVFKWLLKFLNVPEEEVQQAIEKGEEEVRKMAEADLLLAGVRAIPWKCSGCGKVFEKPPAGCPSGGSLRFRGSREPPRSNPRKEVKHHGRET